jgi:hypothetical protein
MSSRDDARPAEVLVAVNRAWCESRFEDLDALLHPRAVIAGFDLARYAEGRDSCLASYRDFVESAIIHAFDVHNVRVEEHDRTAIVTYAYRIRYEMDGQLHSEEGRELLVLVAGEEGWQVAWRQLLPAPGSCDHRIGHPR